MEDISNETIVNFFENKTDNDFKKNFIGYPFIIMNTDRSNKNGMHWWSFLNLHLRKEIFLFDSFGFEGFQESIIDNDRKTLNKILFGIEKLKKKDNKVTLVTLKFSMREYEKMRNGHRLTTTTQDLLHLMYKFGKLHKINNVVTVHLVKNQLQKIETNTCGIFQLYLYVNLFTPLENSSIVNDKKLSKSTLEKLLNEIFYLDRDKNKSLVEQFAEEKDITIDS